MSGGLGGLIRSSVSSLLRILSSKRGSARVIAARRAPDGAAGGVCVVVFGSTAGAELLRG